MPLDYDFLMGLDPIVTIQDWTVRDTILYALGVGAASEAPTDPSELQFVYEEGLCALPTMAVVMAHPGFWVKDPKYGIDWRRVLHGEQWLAIHRALPVAAKLRGVTKIDEIYDKGATKGAIMYHSRNIYDASTGELLATVRQSSFLRGEGGFGGKSEGAPRPHHMPERAPDLVVTACSRADQALLYRLTGDYNPLHADPDVARSAGFRAPILYGLATFGIVGRVLLKTLCANRPERLRRLDVRFFESGLSGRDARNAAMEGGPWARRLSHAGNGAGYDCAAERLRRVRRLSGVQLQSRKRFAQDGRRMNTAAHSRRLSTQGAAVLSETARCLSGSLPLLSDLSCPALRL